MEAFSSYRFDPVQDGRLDNFGGRPAEQT